MENNTIIATIDKTRETIRQTSDDSEYSDMYLYHMLLDSRNLLIERELNKRKMRSSFNWKTLCMPLIKSNEIPCDCIPEDLGCIALRTKYKVPKPISSIFSDTIKILSLDGRKEITMKSTLAGKHNKYSRQGKPPVYATYYNEYIYIIGYPNNNLPAVLIQLIPEDPVEMDNITLCDEKGNELDDTCFDPTKDTFNIDGYLMKAVVESTLATLGKSMQLNEDYTNDNSSPRVESTL